MIGLGHTMVEKGLLRYIESAKRDVEEERIGKK